MWRKATWKFRVLFKANIYTHIHNHALLLERNWRCKTMKNNIFIALIKTIHSIIGFDGTAIFETVEWPLIFSYWCIPSVLKKTQSCKGAALNASGLSARRAKHLRSFTALQNKVLWSPDLVLRSFLFKSMECVCGHKNKIKKNVGKCIGGEVGGFKHLQVETKQPDRALLTSPVVRMFLRKSCSTAGQVWTVSGEKKSVCDVNVFTKKK